MDSYPLPQLSVLGHSGARHWNGGVSEAVADALLDVDADLYIEVNFNRAPIQAVQQRLSGAALEDDGEALHPQDDLPHHRFLEQVARGREEIR